MARPQRPRHQCSRGERLPSSTPEALERGTIGLAKPMRPKEPWSEVVAAHDKAEEEEDKTEAVVIAEGMVRQGVRENYPMVKNNPAYESLIET